MVRKMAVAGSFYVGDPDTLKRQIEQFPKAQGDKVKVKGAIVPHAGLVYSGPVANVVYSKIDIPSTVIVLAPNHYGYGSPVALWKEGFWNSPLGDVPIDEELAGMILDASSSIEEDHLAHLSEHSIEVQLPFLKYYNDNVKLVPIVISSGNLDVMKGIGDDIAEVLKNYPKDVTILASSDMTHYESQQDAEMKDNLAIEKILALDVDGLYGIIRRENISMCGYMPATVMLEAVVKLAATDAKLLKYQTSGDVTGDYERVVGYAGIIIW